jgi:putative membrane protein
MTWPAINACLNAASAALILVGGWQIRHRRIPAHRWCMVLACAVSAVFLVSYVRYHLQAGATRFTGTGWWRPVYFSVLISHTALALVIVPLVGRTLWLAACNRVAAHRRLARWTWPLWLYVSVTGVLVYGMLYHLP